jgi:hypothetical protein
MEPATPSPFRNGSLGLAHSSLELDSRPGLLVWAASKLLIFELGLKPVVETLRSPVTLVHLAGASSFSEHRYLRKVGIPVRSWKVVPLPRWFDDFRCLPLSRNLNVRRSLLEPATRQKMGHRLLPRSVQRGCGGCGGCGGGYWCWINGVRTWCPYGYGY